MYVTDRQVMSDAERRRLLPEHLHDVGEPLDVSLARTHAMKLAIWEAHRHKVRKCKDCGAPVMFLERIIRKRLKTRWKVTRKLIPVTCAPGSHNARPWHRVFGGINGNIKHRRHNCAETGNRR